MKLTAGGKPFGEKKTKAEALESIRQSMVKIGEICGKSKEETNKLIDMLIKMADDNT